MRKIMVVDDSSDFVYLYKKILERAGYEVIEAYDGEECLDKLNQERPDIITLDIMMPGMDGWEVCRRIKEDQKTRDIIVIMVSVKEEKEDIEKSINYAHADEHIGKSSAKDVIKIIERFLAEKR
jgi:CheY-like chemotaxis protein